MQTSVAKDESEESGTIVRWQRVVDANPSDKEAVRELLKAMADHGKWDNVNRLYDQMVSEHVRNYKYRLRIARIATQNKDTDRQYEIWTAMQSDFPDRLEPILGLAKTDHARNEIEASLGWIGKALMIAPQDNGACLLKAKIMQQQNHLDEAIELYSSLLEREREHYEAEINLASALLRKERYEELESRLKRSIGVHEKNQGFHLFLFRAYVKQEKIEQALKVMESLLASDETSKDANIHIENLNLLISLNKLEEADDFCEKALTVFPNNLKILTLHARIGQKKYQNSSNASKV